MALSPYTRTVAIDGVEPNDDTIASGKYPYTAEVYAAYRGNESTNSPAMKLLGWLVSPEGQAVVRESGYVPAK
jgi:phosphate transport system substrate-binding protein